MKIEHDLMGIQYIHYLHIYKFLLYRSAEYERKRETQKRSRLSLGSKIGQMSQVGVDI